MSINKRKCRGQQPSTWGVRDYAPTGRGCHRLFWERVGMGGKDLVTALKYLSHKEVRNGCQYSHISRRNHPT